MDIAFAWDPNEGGAQGSQRFVFFFVLVRYCFNACAVVDEATEAEVEAEVETAITTTGTMAEEEDVLGVDEVAAEVVEATMMTLTEAGAEEEIIVETGNHAAEDGMTRTTAEGGVMEDHQTATMIGMIVGLEDMDLQLTPEDTRSLPSANRLRLLQLQSQVLHLL